jgi:hypothetical protein
MMLVVVVGGVVVVVVVVALGMVVVMALGMVVTGTGEGGVKTRHLQYKYSRFEELFQTNCED